MHVTSCMPEECNRVPHLPGLKLEGLSLRWSWSGLAELCHLGCVCGPEAWNGWSGRIHDISPMDISSTDSSPMDISPTESSPMDISSKSPKRTFRQRYIFNG